MPKKLVAQPELRWVRRVGGELLSGVNELSPLNAKLQQWYAEDLPAYMRDHAQGEWRDVPQVTEGSDATSPA